MVLSVAFVGIGNMGRYMAANLATSGHRVFIYNRTRAKAEALVSELRGGEDIAICSSAEEAAAEAEVVITMVSDGEAVRDIYKGHAGLLSGMSPGAVAVEMSTISPREVHRLAGHVSDAGCTLMDAPVSGNVSMAQEAQLTIMVGGDSEDLERVKPALSSMGRRIFHLGPVGSGATMKLATNTIILGLNQAVSEALVLAERSGIDRLAAYEVFANSAAAAPFVHYRREAFERPSEVPAAFGISLGRKDLQLILGLAESVKARLPQAAANLEVLTAASRRGLEDHDVSSVAEYLRMLSSEAEEGSGELE